MDTNDLEPLIEMLDDCIDDLEEALVPVLGASLTETTGKLPLLDKAQFYVLITYAIESVLFSYLRLNGANAKEHPVFLELTRVKQYFNKIKAAESAGSQPNIHLDKAAAERFIKHALVSTPVRFNYRAYKRFTQQAGNDQRDVLEAERLRRATVEAASKAEAASKQQDLPNGEPGSVVVANTVNTLIGIHNGELEKKKRKRSRKA